MANGGLSIAIGIPFRRVILPLLSFSTAGCLIFPAVIIIANIKPLLAGSLAGFLLVTADAALFYFIGHVLMWSLGRMKSGGPGLIIDSEGIVEGSTALSVGRVPWTEIKSIQVRRDRRHALVLIIVADPGPLIRRLPFIMRWAQHLKSRGYGTPVVLSTRLLRIDPDQLIEELEVRMPKSPRPAVRALTEGFGSVAIQFRRGLLVLPFIGVLLSLVLPIVIIVANVRPLLAGSLPVFPLIGICVTLIYMLGLALIWGLRRMLSTQPALVIDSEGIVDGSTALSAGRVRWAEIASVQPRRQGKYVSIAILVTDPEAVIRRVPFTNRWLQRMNWRLGGTPVIISTRCLNVDPDQLIEELKSRLRK